MALTWKCGKDSKIPQKYSNLWTTTMHRKEEYLILYNIYLN